MKKLQHEPNASATATAETSALSDSGMFTMTSCFLLDAASVFQDALEEYGRSNNDNSGWALCGSKRNSKFSGWEVKRHDDHIVDLFKSLQCLMTKSTCF